MNTHAECRRHSYRPPEQPAVPDAVAPAASELARHRDPSLQQEQPAREQAKKRAQEMQVSLDAMVQDERDTEALMEHLDRMIAELIDLAQDWDSVDPDMAARVRQQEQQIHDLRGRVERLGEMEAGEAAKIIGAIRHELRHDRGES